MNCAQINIIHSRSFVGRRNHEEIVCILSFNLLTEMWNKLGRIVLTPGLRMNIIPKKNITLIL